MDDTIIFLIALLTNDPILQALWNTYAPPGTVVNIQDPEQRVEAQYPVIVPWGQQGMLDGSGDLNPAIWDGKLYIDTYTKQADPYCKNATRALAQITQRTMQLIVGSVAQGLPQLRGTYVSANWYVSECRPIMPTGRIPNALDATIRWHRQTYATTLNNYTVGY